MSAHDHEIGALRPGDPDDLIGRGPFDDQSLRADSGLLRPRQALVELLLGPRPARRRDVLVRLTGTSWLMTWTTSSSLRLLLAISIAFFKAAPDADEKSEGWRMRRIMG